MQFSKPMIELVFEIRRFVGPELKPSIKLANPELFHELQTHYHQGSGAVTKALIKELFSLAGGDWPSRLENQAPPVAQKLRVYRGQASLDDKPSAESNPSARSNEADKKRKTRIYRGQVITE